MGKKGKDDVKKDPDSSGDLFSRVLQLEKELKRLKRIGDLLKEFPKRLLFR